MIYNDYGNMCNFCTVYIVLFAIAFLLILGISSSYFYIHCYLKKSNTNITNNNPDTETVIC